MALSNDERREISETIARSCRIMGKLDMTHAALGHVSYRIPGTDTMLIKAKGPDEVGVRYTRPEDIIEVDFNANKIWGPDGLQPPSESYLHLWMYKKNPEVQCVIHIHPRPAVLLTICNKPILPIYSAYGTGVSLALEGVETYQRSIRILNDELGEDFATFMGTKKVALMRGHGISVVGSSVEDATVRAIALDELTTMNYQAYLLGDPQPIPDIDLEFMKKPQETNKGRGSVGGEVGMLATWRYYSMLTDEYETG
ncbi:MAG TPA: class II aldolase/adducin family protein [Acidimicrobiales bacterium]|nr:class II aldolase/adducin family protein [Acidimicrobiales bacterium]